MKSLQLIYKSVVLAIGIIILLPACEKDILPTPPQCTYTKDPECFCDMYPDNPLCNIPDCTFELDKECYCENAPEDQRCQDCTFEDDPECFCDLNPTDQRCQSNSGSGFYTFFDFEEENIVIDSIFSTGYTGDNPDGWQSDARATANLVMGDAPQGSNYFSVELEVLNEAWAWTSNLYKADTIDASSLSEPTLNFWIRTSNGKPLTAEFALVDATGESGWHPGGAYMEIDDTWKQFSVKLSEIEWQWGDGLDLSSIYFFKFGFNINGQSQGDIFEVHVDNIYLDDGVPDGAIAYPSDPGEETNKVSIFNFEEENIIIDSIFSTGYTGDNPEGWQSDARAVGSIQTGDAAEGNQYFSAELEVINENWAWTSNLFKTEDYDLSAFADPTLNFYARTSHGKPATLEFALVDDSGESGWHPGGNYSELNGEWQLFSVRLNEISWQWGDGIDASMINFFKFGFNINGQAQGDIFEIHIDDIHFSDGSAGDAIIYPEDNGMTGGNANYERFFTYFNFEGDLVLDSIFSTGYTEDNPNGWQSDGRAIPFIVSENAPEGDSYFSVELEVINEAWAWTSNLFSAETIDASGLTDPTLNFWIRTSHEKPVTLEFAFQDTNGESGWHPGGNYAEVNGNWQLVSISLLDIPQWRWGSGPDYGAINFFKMGFNINSQLQGDIFEIHVDDVHLSNGSPEGAVVYPQE